MMNTKYYINNIVTTNMKLYIIKRNCIALAREYTKKRELLKDLKAFKEVDKTSLFTIHSVIPTR